MVKSKKSVKKGDDTIEEAPIENSVDHTVEEENKSSQENGEVVSVKKKSRSLGKLAIKEKASEPSRKSSRASKPIKSNEEEAYEVENLVDFRLHKGKAQYLVRWKGYSKAEDTWEDESGLNCPELLQKFKEGHPESRKSPKKRAASKSPHRSTKKAKPAKAEPKDYEVEEIVGHRFKSGKKEFKIRWKGYKPSDDSWEPEQHLSCQDLIQKYLEEHKDEIEAQKENKTPSKKTPAKSNKKGKKSKAK